MNVSQKITVFKFLASTKKKTSTSNFPFVIASTTYRHNTPVKFLNDGNANSRTDIEFPNLLKVANFSLYFHVENDFDQFFYESPATTNVARD